MSLFDRVLWRKNKREFMLLFIILFTILIQTVFYNFLLSNNSKYTSVFDTFNIKLTEMDSVDNEMRSNLRPARTFYQKIIYDNEPGVFLEGPVKDRFATRIQNCLVSDKTGAVSIKILDQNCINIEEILFFFLSILNFLVALGVIWKLFQWLDEAVKLENVPLSNIFLNWLNNRPV